MPVASNQRDHPTYAIGTSLPARCGDGRGVKPSCRLRGEPPGEEPMGAPEHICFIRAHWMSLFQIFLNDPGR